MIKRELDDKGFAMTWLIIVVVVMLVIVGAVAYIALAGNPFEKQAFVETTVTVGPSYTTDAAEKVIEIDSVNHKIIEQNGDLDMARFYRREGELVIVVRDENSNIDKMSVDVQLTQSSPSKTITKTLGPLQYNRTYELRIYTLSPDGDVFDEYITDIEVPEESGA